MTNKTSTFWTPLLLSNLHQTVVSDYEIKCANKPLYNKVDRAIAVVKHQSNDI